MKIVKELEYFLAKVLAVLATLGVGQRAQEYNIWAKSPKNNEYRDGCGLALPWIYVVLHACGILTSFTDKMPFW